MRVLFIPCAGTPLPHLIPLLALSSRLDPRRHESAFLVPRALRRPLEAMGRRVVSVDYAERQSFRGEMLAYGQFRPDVVVDDLGTTVLLSTTLNATPRVAIRRTGVFPGVAPRNGLHGHSAADPTAFAHWYKDSEALCGIPAPRSVADLCAASMNVIPGIRTIEALPAALVDDPAYQFAGSLMLSDPDCERLFGAMNRASADAGALSAFIAANQGRLIVYLTLGSVLRATGAIQRVVQHIVESGAALVSSIDPPDVAPALRERCFFAPILPMDAVASRAHLMIHHCGSGTYQYQVRHKLPAICIGSGCYDRDDVAMRLEELGVARYLAGPGESRDFVEAFGRAFDDCSAMTGPWYARARAVLTQLDADGERTSARFDFDAVLERAVAMRRASAAVAGRAHTGATAPRG